MIDGQNDTIVIGLQACAPVFATGSIDDAAEAGEEGSCCNGFQVDWLSEDVRRLLAAHGFTAPDPVDSVARRMVEREVLTPGMPLAAMPVESLYKPWTSLPGSQFGGLRCGSRTLLSRYPARHRISEQHGLSEREAAGQTCKHAARMRIAGTNGVDDMHREPLQMRNFARLRRIGAARTVSDNH